MDEKLVNDERMTHPIYGWNILHMDNTSWKKKLIIIQCHVYIGAKHGYCWTSSSNFLKKMKIEKEDRRRSELTSQSPLSQGSFEPHEPPNAPQA